MEEKPRSRAPAPIKPLELDELDDPALPKYALFACKSFPYAKLEPILSQYCSDTIKRKQLWPHVAFAADQYRWERTERRKYTGTEPTPTQVRKLLSDISAHGDAFANALIRLHDLSFRLDDPTAPFQRAHLGYFNLLIHRATVGSIFLDPPLDARSAVHAFSGWEQFIKKVAGVVLISREAKRRLDPKLLKRTAGQPRDAALFNFVGRLAEVWIVSGGLDCYEGPEAKCQSHGKRAAAIRALRAIHCHQRGGTGTEPKANRVGTSE